MTAYNTAAQLHRGGRHMRREEIAGVIAEMEALHEAGVGIVVKTDKRNRPVNGDIDRRYCESCAFSSDSVYIHPLIKQYS